ncbi:conserved hypothetical protein [Candidatus Nitrotoga sp. BS]|uniref:hypothetical protein n=1 Tax=Candidatus Nitrotoga sp. BS TaxID=2890408 RepID=UPI001EF2ED01|nr:hypothetical protein [Candidatus Nitrotoga sp. BS]CAH1198452.1 conserved hypothetical protein [Candidatus Nitrotoga sp. BS]
MSSKSNIDHFNRVVLVTLDKLYDAFPVPTELKVAEISEAATPDSVPAEPTFNDLESTFEAIKFLAKEDFIHFSDHFLDGTTFLQVQLTLKGLTVLGYAPDSLEKKVTLISQVKSALKFGAKGSANEATKQVISSLFAAAITAAPTAVAALTR